MIINGKEVLGIYKYEEGLNFSSGDFVVYEDNIYICQNNTSSSPEEDKTNYKPYLSEKEATWEDFQNLYDLGSGDNGIITSRVLNQILKKLTFGIDSTGIITEEIMNNYISPGLGEFTGNNTKPLDQLILNTKDTEMNNLVLKIDRFLNDTPGALIKILPEGLENNVIDEDFKSVILKQYTYKESNLGAAEGKLTYRIQELIDPFFGVCFYRFVRLSENSNEGNISNWKQSNISSDYINKLAAYSKALKERWENYNNDTTKFNFRKINLSNPTASDSSRVMYVVSLVNYEIATITISTSFNSSNGIIANCLTMTVPVDNKEYFFPGSEISVICDDNSIILNTGGKLNTTIIDVYVREN